MERVYSLIVELLERNDLVAPRDALMTIACVTLVSYLVLLVAGRGRA